MASEDEAKGIGRSELRSGETPHAVVAALRHQLRQVEQAWRGGERRGAVSLGSGALDGLIPSGGMSRGTIHHWFAAEAGSGAEVLSLLAAREACGTQGNLIVFDPDEAFYPPGAAGWGIDLNRTVVLRGGAVRDRAWAIDQALQCDAVAAVWGPLPALDARWLRRFQLSAEQSGCIGLFVRPATAPRVPAWCETQWLCRGFAPRRGDSAPADSGSPFDRTIELQLLRARGGLPGARFILRLDFQNGTVQWERRHEPAHLVPLARQLADPKTRRRAARA